MKRTYTSRRSPLAYVIAMGLMMFVLAELFVMVLGSKPSLIKHVLRGRVFYSDYSEEEFTTNKMDISVALEEQGVGLTTNTSPVLKEALEKHTHEGLSIEPDVDETDDEIEPVG